MNALRQAQAAIALAEQAEQQARIDAFDLLEFFESAWREVLQPSVTFHRDRALEAYCAHAEALLSGRSQPYLIVNVGPGHAKSWFWSVVLPAAIWVRQPGRGIVCASRNIRPLGVRDADRCLKLCRSNWYARHSPVGARIDADAALQFTNQAGGHRVTLSVNGSTGLRGESLILDDPMTHEQAHSQTYCDAVYDWMRGDWMKRLNEGGWMATIMQRLSERDPVARWLHDFGDKTDLLCLQEERSRIAISGPLFGEPGFKHTSGESSTALTRSGLWVDDRADGELLSPLSFGPDRAAMEKRDAYNWMAQRQQSPLPIEAGARMLKEYTGTIRFTERYGYTPAEAVAKHGWRQLAGFDHGVGAGREVAVVGIYHPLMKRIVILRDYRNVKRTIPAEDAFGVRAKFDELGLNPLATAHAYGDVGGTGKGDISVQTINQALRDARWPDGRPVLGFTIATADKSQGTVISGCELMNIAFSNDILQVDEACQDLDTSLKGWTGGEEHKDLCDALRYVVFSILRHWLGVDSGGMVSA